MCFKVTLSDSNLFPDTFDSSSIKRYFRENNIYQKTRMTIVKV